MFQRLRHWFFAQPDTSSSCDDSDHAVLADSSSSHRPLASNAVQSLGEPRHSTENVNSKIDAGALQSKRSDFRSPNRPRSANLRTTFEMDPNPAEPHIMSLKKSPPREQEASTYLNAQKGDTSRRAEWLRLQDNFVHIAKRTFSAFRPELSDQHVISQLEHTLQQLEAAARGLRDWHTQFDNSINDNTHLVPRQSTIGFPYSQSFWRANGARSASYADIKDVPDVEDRNPTKVTEPDSAALYYKYASAVRYLSDDLVNLGPPPPDVARYPWGDSDDGDSDVLSPQQYAEQHLKLLTEITEARQQAAKYKQLCIESDIKLDGVSNNEDADHDADDQDEDLYRSTLSEREFGPSRIDSIIAIQGVQRPNHRAPVSPRFSPASRTAEWAANLDAANMDEAIA